MMDHAIAGSFPSSLKELTLSSADRIQKDVQSRMTYNSFFTVYSPVFKKNVVNRARNYNGAVRQDINPMVFKKYFLTCVGMHCL